MRKTALATMLGLVLLLVPSPVGSDASAQGGGSPSQSPGSATGGFVPSQQVSADASISFPVDI